jgi:hypothetical protein
MALVEASSDRSRIVSKAPPRAAAVLINPELNILTSTRLLLVNYLPQKASAQSSNTIIPRPFAAATIPSNAIRFPNRWAMRIALVLGLIKAVASSTETLTSS